MSKKPFLTALLSLTCCHDSTIENARSSNLVQASAVAAEPIFWDGKPVDIAGHKKCASQTDGYDRTIINRQMFAGPSWNSGTDIPDRVKDEMLAIGGLKASDVLMRDGECKFVYAVDAVVDGTQYRWRAICPFHVAPENPKKIAFLDLPGCTWY